MAEGFGRAEWVRGWRTANTPWVSPASDDLLEGYLPCLRRLVPRGRALIPLCGNSRAVRCLYDEGYEVTGIEYVPEAVRALIRARFPRHRFRLGRVPHGRVYSARRVNFFEQDVFTFRARESFDFIYDRAAIIAIPPRTRRRYAAILSRALKPGGVMMVVGFTCTGGSFPGPPFPISRAEIRRLFPGFSLIAAKERRIQDPAGRFTSRGVRAMAATMLVLRKSGRRQG